MDEALRKLDALSRTLNDALTRVTSVEKSISDMAVSLAKLTDDLNNCANDLERKIYGEANDGR